MDELVTLSLNVTHYDNDHIQILKTMASPVFMAYSNKNEFITKQPESCGPATLYGLHN